MVTNKLTSINRVISKVYSDLDIDESNVPVVDMVEWAAEALDSIEAPTMLTNKVAGKEGIPLLEINNYQAQIPLDCTKIIQVAYTKDKHSDNFYPMSYASGSFAGRHGLTSLMSNEHYNDPTPNVVGDYELIDLTMELYDISYEEALEKLNSDSDLKSTLTSLLLDKNKLISSDAGTIDDKKLEYSLVPGYIKTNVRDGYLMVSYLAIPTDEKGFPMVPDHPSFINALYWYILSKIHYSNAIKNKIPFDIYLHAHNRWNFYVKQAYGKAMMPSTIDELESIKDSHLKLIPNINSGKNFFKDLNSPERLRTYTNVNYG